MNKQQQGYGYGHGDSPYCCFHPRELIVGVCPHCLKARLLLLLAAKDKDGNSNPAPPLLRRRSRSRTNTTSSGSSISLPKVFALGSSFLQRLDSRGHYTHRTDADAAAAADPNPNDGNCSDDTTTSVSSLDDSFISIKFEDNGKATWDDSHKHQHVIIATTKATTKTKSNKQQAAPATRSSSSSTVVMMVPEHAKRGGVTRWRKQVVGRLLQLARWKRSKAAASGAAAASHVGLDGKKQDGSSKAIRGRAGWIRSLTRRRAAAAHGDRPWS